MLISLKTGAVVAWFQSWTLVDKRKRSRGNAPGALERAGALTRGGRERAGEVARARRPVKRAGENGASWQEPDSEVVAPGGLGWRWLVDSVESRMAPQAPKAPLFVSWPPGSVPCRVPSRASGVRPTEGKSRTQRMETCAALFGRRTIPSGGANAS